MENSKKSTNPSNNEPEPNKSDYATIYLSDTESVKAEPSPISASKLRSSKLEQTLLALFTFRKKNMTPIENKVAIIAQGATGIGKATAVECLKKGANISILDENSEEGEQVLQDLRQVYGAERSIFIKCDFTNNKDLEDAFRQTKRVFGKINIIINCCTTFDPIHWEKMMDINFNSIVRTTRLGFRFMSKEHGGDGGVIVNVSSEAGLEYIKDMPEYAASKHAVVAYSMNCAFDPDTISKHGIRINIICPGATNSPIIDVIKSHGFNLSMLKFLPPEYVAEGIMILVEDETRNGVIMHLKEEKKFHIIHQKLSVVETLASDKSVNI